MEIIREYISSITWNYSYSWNYHCILNPERISAIIRDSFGFLGVLLAAIVGSLTLIPGFIAFPTAVILLQNGAGYMQLGAFISTLMMVGVMILPIEQSYFGKKLTIIRNDSTFIFSLLVAFIIGCLGTKGCYG